MGNTSFLRSEKDAASVSVPNKVGGRLQYFLSYWETLTTDRFILECVKGVRISFISEVNQFCPQLPLCLSQQETELITVQLNKYLACGIVEDVEHCKNKYISKSFSRPKSSGEVRVILNLKIID